MTDDTLILNEQKGLHEARTVLKAHLPLAADGSVCTRNNWYDVLLGVAVHRGTLQSVCQDWLGIADPETIRGYLNSQWRVEDLPVLERHLNAAWAARIPSRVKRHAQDVAADLRDRPYDGKQSQEEALRARGAARDGTTRF